MCPVSDYASGVWGFSEHTSFNTVPYGAIQSFLGIHKFTSLLTISGDMGWESPTIKRCI